ncbi:MAG: YihY/virulence factor BrkB family protein [Pseudomonadota bacterium]
MNGTRHMRRWGRAAGVIWTALDEKNLFLVAAGCAFYGILSVFPALSAIIALWGLVSDPAFVAQEMERFRALVPDEVYSLIQSRVLALTQADGQTLGWASAFSLAVAIWTARASVAALMRGLNAIYGVPNRRGIGHTVRALALTMALIGVALVALAGIVVAPLVIAFVPETILGGPATVAMLNLLRWALVIGVLLAGFCLILRIGPNVTGRDRPLLSAGAVAATVGWTAASAGFSIYLAQFAQYNEVYGSIGAVIALLMWLFLSALLVLLGGALNAALRGPVAGDDAFSPQT